MDDAAHPNSDPRRGYEIHRAGTTPIRFAVLVLAFIVHLVAWTGFSAMRAAAASYYVGDDFATGFIMLALAWTAGAAAIVIARFLAPIPRNIVIVASVAIFGISGFAEVDFRLAATAEVDGPGWLAVFSYLGSLIFPFILAGVVIAVMRIRSAGRSETDRAGAKWPAIILFVCALAIAAVFVAGTFISLSTLLGVNWLGIVISLAGTTSALFVLEHMPSAVFRRTRVASPRVFGFFVLACGMHICIVSAGQIVNYGPVGIAGFTLWTYAVFGFVIAAVALLISYNGPKIRVV
ncbi:MAG: hypothetical protein ACTIC1_20665 [Brevibacterium sp.]